MQYCITLIILYTRFHITKHFMAKIYHAILDFISNLWGRLFSMREESGEREPLTKFSIFIVILLDIFLFYLVYT